MADNTAQGGTDTIATDDIAGVKHQRVKVEYGADGSATDVSSTTPLPAATPSATTTGSITAAAQTVAHTVPDNHSSYTIELTGTFANSGTVLIVECSIDGTNWHATNVRPNTSATVNEQYTTTTTDITGGSGMSPSMWKGTSGGVTAIRVRCSTYGGADSVNVRITSSAGLGGTFLLGGLSDVRGSSIASTSGAIAAAGTGTVGPHDVSRSGNVSFIVKNTVAASAWAGSPVLVFEQSDDGTSWAPMAVVDNATGAVASTHYPGVNTASTEKVYEAQAESINSVRVRVTTGPTTNGLTVNIQSASLPFVPFVTAIDRKDAARTQFSLTYTSTAPVVADTLLSMVPSRSHVAAAAATTHAATAGRVLRITGVFLSLRATAATLPYGLLTVRVNPSGAAVIGSNGIAVIGVSGSAAVIGNTGTRESSVTDGIVEISGTQQIGFSFSNNLVSNVANITVVGYEYPA